MDPFTLALLGGVLMGGKGAPNSAERLSSDYNPVTAINTSGGGDLKGIGDLLTTINSQNAYNSAIWKGDPLSELASPYATPNLTYLIIGGIVLVGIFLWRK